MNGIILVMALAVITEGLVEYVKTLGKAIGSKDFKTFGTQICAMALSIALCVLTGADVFAPLGIVFGYEIVGVILTGLFASRGANYVADIVKRIQSLGEKTTETIERS